MPHPYRIREIAQQAGLSEATVDRALHDRPGVRAGTIGEVRQAIAELDRQREQVRLSGRTFLLDLVMQAPRRFSSAVRQALETSLPQLRPANLRARFHLSEQDDPQALVAVLDRVSRRGTHGVLLKAPDDPRVIAAVNRLVDAGIPVVTLATDLPASRRAAYVGIDNQAAGATAAYLLTRTTPGSSAGILVSLSSNSFRGEEEREAGFRTAMREMAPARGLIEVPETDGLNPRTLAAVTTALRQHPDLDAVYSIGGGNTAILQAFADAGRVPTAFVAHDLDGDNITLLRDGRLTAVLHHDLPADLRQACRSILAARGVVPGPPWAAPSQIQVITPFNLPVN